MGEMPESFRKHLAESLLGQLKLILFERITGSKGYLPEPAQVRLFLIDLFRSQPGAATVFGVLLNVNRSDAANYESLPNICDVDVDGVLSALETYPLEEPFFLEINNCPEPWPSSLGILFYWERLAVGGCVYVATLFNPAVFPDMIVGHAEVRASCVAPEPAFSILRADTYEVVSRQDHGQDEIAKLLARSLKYVEQNRFRSFVACDEAMRTRPTPREDIAPPRDPHFDGLIRQVLLRQKQCTEVEVEMSLVRPHSFDFALTFPLDVVDQSVRMIHNGFANRILTYWHNGSFVMSDDYPLYLAYRKLNHRKVAAVVMGAFPEGSAKPGRVGGAELLPPIFVQRSRDHGPFPTELQEFLLDTRLRQKPASDEVCKLYRLSLDLASLVRNPHAREKQFHDLLRRNPIAIDAFGLRIRSEVSLGANYRVDLLLQYEYTDKRILLIELEKGGIPIFTRSGRPRARVTHAIQQVEDWLQWWREHPGEAPKGLDGSIPVEGLVIVGRAEDMDEGDKRRLLSLNHTRQVQVITYDDLLDRIRNLIVNLEDGTGRQCGSGRRARRNN